MSAILKAEVQARIAAATVATSSTDLAILRVTGERLGCDMTNLNAVATSLANTTLSGDTGIELAKRAKALAVPSSSGAPVIHAVLPFNVEAGDVVYADDLGALFKNAPHDITTRVVSTATMGATSRDHILLNVDNEVEHNAERSSFSARITLPDGNVLLVVASPDSTLHLRAMTPGLDKDLSTSLAYSLSDGTNTVTSSVTHIGIYPTATVNQYAFYYRTIFSSGDPNAYLIRRVLFTRNPTTQAITQGGVSTIYSTPSGGAITLHLPHSRIGRRYVLLSFVQSSNYVTCWLDLQTGVVTEHTFRNTSQPTLCTEIVPADGIPRWLVLRGGNGGTVHMLRPAAASDTLPAGVNAELNSSWAAAVSDFADLVVVFNHSTGRVRIIKFSSDATSATITPVGDDGIPALMGLGSISSVIYSPNGRFHIYVSSGDIALSFKWDGVAASDVRYGGYAFPGLAGVALGWIDLSKKAMRIYSTPSINNVMFCTVATLSAMVHRASTPIAVATGSFSAGSMASLAPAPNTVKGVKDFTKAFSYSIAALGLRAVGRPEYVYTYTADVWTTVISAMEPSQAASSPVQRSFNSGSGLLLPEGGDFIFTQSTTYSQIMLKPLFRGGSFSHSASSGVAKARVRTNTPVVAFVSANTGYVNMIGEVV